MMIRAYSLEQILKRAKVTIDRLEHGGCVWSKAATIYYYSGTDFFSQETSSVQGVPEDSTFSQLLRESIQCGTKSDVMGYADPLAAGVGVREPSVFFHNSWFACRAYDITTLSAVVKGQTPTHLNSLPPEMRRMANLLSGLNLYGCREFEVYQDSCCGRCSKPIETSDPVWQCLKGIG